MQRLAVVIALFLLACGGGPRGQVMSAVDAHDLDLAMQDLRANEAPFAGEEDYMAHRTRDASFEEVA